MIRILKVPASPQLLNTAHRGIMHINTMKYLLLILLIYSPNLLAQRLCEPIVSKGEGHWPIPEAAFIKEKAREAIFELEALLDRSKGDLLTSADSGGLDLSPYVINRLVYIKGFTLKSSAIEDQGEAYAKWSRKEFCDFLREEALVWH